MMELSQMTFKGEKTDDFSSIEQQSALGYSGINFEQKKQTTSSIQMEKTYIR